MVFENLIFKNVFQKKYIFFLTVLYSVIGILIARFIFGSSSGIVSVAFISFLLIPTIRQVLLNEKEIEEKEKIFSFKTLIKNNKNIFYIYSLIFAGVFFTYLMLTFVLPQLGINVFNVFTEQLYLDPSLKGRAFDIGTFWGIMANNWIVLIVCFLLGLISGDGAIFFVAWNASAWGTIFGFKALTAGTILGGDPWLYLIIMLSIVIWHTAIEGVAYILAAIAGSTISKDVISKTSQSNKFYGYFIIGGLAVFLINNFIRIRMVSLKLLISISLFLTWIYFMKIIFEEEKYRLVFKYNYWLFIIALAIFLVGALVEAYVLNSSTMLQTIYAQSYRL